MPIMAPWFRDRNYARITQLDNAGYSPQTIAGIVNDESESQVKYTASDIRGYLKVQADGSNRMLISKNKLKVVMGDQSSEFEPV